MDAADRTELLGDGRDVAIVTESVECGGTERVVQALGELLPQARIVANHFSDLMSPDAEAVPWAARAHLVPSGRYKHHFLAPLYGRRLAAAQPLGSARVVVALSSSGWALAPAAPPGARLLCYSAGVPRALYRFSRLYLRNEPALVRPVLRAATPLLKRYVRELMRRPDRVVTNSRYSADATRRAFGRDAEVVHPPVRTGFFTPVAEPRRHFLVVARLVPQKRLDVLVDAFAGIDETLVVVGRGPWLERLGASAPPNVRLAGWVQEEELRHLYRSSRALLCPSIEDFGIAMAEAHACGVPVIAPRDGGALEIVEDGVTGILLDRVEADDVVAAIRRLDALDIDSDACRAVAERFGEDRFAERMAQILAEELAAATGSRRGCPPTARAARRYAAASSRGAPGRVTSRP